MSRYPIDTAWFKQKIKEKRLSQRKMGSLLDIRHESLSRVFRGLTPLRLEQATKIAEFFGVSLHEVLRRAGVSLPPPAGMALPIVGAANGALLITPGKYPSLDSIPIFEQAAEGVVCDDRKSPLHGWVFVYLPADIILPAAIGRFSIVRLADGRKYIRFLRPGLHAGRFDLVPLSTGRPFVDVDDISAAAPILHILPLQRL